MAGNKKKTLEEIFEGRRYLDAEKDAEKILEAIMNGEVSDLDVSDEDETQEASKQPAILNSAIAIDDSSSENDEHPSTEKENPLAHESASRRQFWKKTEKFDGIDDGAWSSSDSAASRHSWTPQEYVSIFWDDAFLKSMCKYTNIRHHQETGNVLNIDLNDMKAYLGATMLMSCLGYPRIRMYWQKTTYVPIIANAITRNAFFKIRSHLKVIDDTQVSDEEKKKDKLWKIRPIMDRVRKGCLTLPHTKNLAIDEQMIPFTGTCAVKQYVPGKPNPEGLKNFVLAAPSGLVLDFEVYQGKNTLLAGGSAKNLGVGGAAVLRLVETVGKGTNLYLDRYFTSIGLITELRKREIACSGTIMKSRIPSAVHLTDDKIMAKMERGSYDMSVRQDDEICVVKWYDKKSVLLCSSKFGVKPLDKCKRWSKKDNKYLEIPRPKIVKEYNTNMGGIDLIDRMISYYRIKTRTKKWTVKTILHFFDLSLVNAWILMREDKKCNVGGGEKFMQFLDFKILIAEHLLRQSDLSESSEEEQDITSPSTRKRKRLDTSVKSTPSSKKNAKHLPKMMDIKNAMRCKNKSCSQKTKIMCIKCNLYFCLTAKNNCFADVHS